MSDLTALPFDAGWDLIEQEARQQVREELTAAENTPLVFGAAIGWTECYDGRTRDLLPLHRVGFPNGGYAFTTCGEVIPPPVRWRVLSPAIIRTAAKCRFCEAEAMRAKQGNAA
jgi:hypothetical protein